jgi:hypothetical protein
MKAVITCAIALTALIAFASPVKAQECDPLNGPEAIIDVCGFVWNDLNSDGIQNDDTDLSTLGDQSGINDVTVFLFVLNTSTNQWDPVSDTQTSDGIYSFGDLPDGQYKVVVGVPTGTIPTATGEGFDTSLDNDGVSDTLGSAAEFCIGTALQCVTNKEADFGFKPKPIVNVPPPPGTGTPGYWKNHTEVWAGITIGGIYYSSTEAAALMGKVSKDKAISLFSQLVAAKLNVLIGNDASCIAGTITDADNWMASHPIGSGVTASSTYWQQIAQAHKDLDDYNNGRLCAPHRN